MRNGNQQGRANTRQTANIQVINDIPNKDLRTLRLDDLMYVLPDLPNNRRSNLEVTKVRPYRVDLVKRLVDIAKALKTPPFDTGLINGRPVTEVNATVVWRNLRKQYAENLQKMIQNKRLPANVVNTPLKANYANGKASIRTMRSFVLGRIKTAKGQRAMPREITNSTTNALLNELKTALNSQTPGR